MKKTFADFLPEHHKEIEYTDVEIEGAIIDAINYLLSKLSEE